MKRLRVILVGLGRAESKREIIDDLLTLDHDFIVLVSDSAPTDFGAFGDAISKLRLVPVDFRDPSEISKCVKSISDEAAVDGVSTFLEECVPIANRLALELDLVPICNGDVRALRHKGLMREGLRSGGVEQPLSFTCKTISDAKQAVEKTGLPAVIKPAELLGSLGVKKLLTGADEEVENAFIHAQSADRDDERFRETFGLGNDVVIEEYIAADYEVSVEAIVTQGSLSIAAVTRKDLGPEPLFQEMGHTTPYPTTAFVHEALRQQLEMSIRALELINTAVHAEFRIRTGQLPVLVEIGARIGGDLIPVVLRMASGFSLPRAMVLAALRNDVRVTSSRDRIGAILFFDSMRDLEAAKSAKLPSGARIEGFEAYEAGGAGRSGHLIVTAETLSQIDICRSSIASTASRLPLCDEISEGRFLASQSRQSGDPDDR